MKRLSHFRAPLFSSKPAETSGEVAQQVTNALYPLGKLAKRLLKAYHPGEGSLQRIHSTQPAPIGWKGEMVKRNPISIIVFGSGMITGGGGVCN